MDTTEDALDSFLQQMILHHIPPSMWSFEVISRITSTLGSPIAARIIGTPSKSPPRLIVYVTTNRDFNYLQGVNVKMEGWDRSPVGNTEIAVEYLAKKHFCHRCHGYSHWSLHYADQSESSLWSAHFSNDHGTDVQTIQGS